MTTPTKPKTAPEFLAQAGAIMAQRAAQYDQPGGERSMGRTVEAFNVITGHKLSEADGWLLLQCLKDVRQWQNPDEFHRDSAEDGVAYSALKAEALARGDVMERRGSDCILPCDWRMRIDSKGETCMSCGATRSLAP